MKNYEKRIAKIMDTEGCDRATAERFYELSEMITSDEFTPEMGKAIYAELEALRAN